MEKERKKKVSVTYVKDEDVVQHILHIEERKSGRKKQPKKHTFSYSEGGGRRRGKVWLSSLETDMGDSSSDGEDAPTHLSALRVDEENIAGEDVFSFHTPKKAGQMILKAAEIQKSLTPATPKSQQKGKLSRSQSLSEKRSSSTPQNKSLASVKQNRAPQTTTPYRLRKRNAMEEEESDEDSVDEESEEEDDEDAMDTDSVAQRSKAKGAVELTTNAEEYFDLHAASVVTSDRTLSRLDLPQMDVGVLRETLEKSGQTHSKQRKHLCAGHQKLFRRWMFNMCNGFNILVYGLGSKRQLLEQFQKEYLSSFSHLVVNGYFPSLTIKQILNSITADLLDYDGTFRSPLDQVAFIKEQLQHQAQDMYLIFHNIDGAMLRGEKTQNVLSVLAQVPGVHFVASVDHINAPLIWDQAKASRFRWLWQDLTTYSPYISETSYENSLLVQQSGALALRSLTHVMRSLTLNARKIFELLAQYQLDNADTAAPCPGMSFQDLYVRCRESFLVNSDQTLRAQLVEFRDHKLIRSKKNFDGVEYLEIPLEASALKEFLEQGDDKQS